MARKKKNKNSKKLAGSVMQGIGEKISSANAIRVQPSKSLKSHLRTRKEGDFTPNYKGIAEVRRPSRERAETETDDSR